MNEITERIIDRLTDRNHELRQFALRLLNPEDLGHAVPAEVRDAARKALGMQQVEGRK